MPRAKSKAAFMISAVAEQYGVHPQTLRLYEREGLLKPSRSDGNTRLYTAEDVDLATARRTGLETLAMLVGSADWEEGMGAFKEKRPPRFE